MTEPGLNAYWTIEGRNPEPIALRPPPSPFMEEHGKPYIMTCSCGCLERGKPCHSNGRRIQREREEYDRKRELLAVLTDDDKAQLEAWGWKP